NYAFVAGDNGAHSFSATLKTSGTRSLTATDTTTSSIKGTEASITVKASSSGSPGGLPQVTYHGGPLLQHVQVESVYYGQAWNSDSKLQQQIPQVDGFLQYFTSSPYMDVLKQYN